MNREPLHDAYERLHRMGPEYGGDADGNNGLTNHGPMAAEVLARRGHEDRIARWVDSYVPRLVELPKPKRPIGATEWRHALGDAGRLGDWVAWFNRELTEAPWRHVLAQWWPRLLPGIAAGATHGAIRVGHAVRNLTGPTPAPSAISELAQGMAFWAARSRPVPATREPVGTLSAARALDGVPRLADQSGLIVDRLGRLAALGDWPAAQAALRAPLDADDAVTLLENLVDTATVRYLGFGYASPVLLVHTATAPNAVLHTLPVLPRDLWAPSLAAAWSASAAITATYAPRRAVPRADFPAAPGGQDPAADVVQRAAEHGDEHVIKFTDTAAEVYERTGDLDALAAAVHISALIR